MPTKIQTYMLIGALDISYSFIVIASYIVDTFQYMNHFHMSLFKITYQYHEGKLLAKVPSFYLQFNHYFCSKRSNLEFKEICDQYSSFYNAAIVYISFTLFNFLLVLYNLFHLTALCQEWTPRWYLKLGLSHYLYPIVHSIAILVYFSVIDYYGLSPPEGFGNDFQMNAKSGLFLMLIAQVVSAISLFIYLFSRNEATGNESFVEDTNEEGYQKIDDKPVIQGLPVLKVSEVFKSDSDESETSNRSKKSKEIRAEKKRKSESRGSEESKGSDESDDDSDSDD